MAKRVIGILTWFTRKKFGQLSFFRTLIEKGQELGATVYLFSPNDVFAEKYRIRGYIPASNGGWRSKWFSWPDIVIDYYRFYPVPKHQPYLAFRKQPLFTYVNSRFSNKWVVHQLLCDDENMQKWMPETMEYSLENLLDMALRHQVLYLKPSNGTAGRSILCIKQIRNTFSLLGRDQKNAIIAVQLDSLESLVHWLETWTFEQKLEKEIFLLQQGLDLSLVPNRTVDFRLLIQKNEVGKWSITGIGTRVGGEKSSTSNLHGGGSAISSPPFLASRFGREQAINILRECRELAYTTAESVERHFGRMMELGLDIGVDKQGRVWLIEINPKPGRDIFKHLKQFDLYERAVSRPIQYALYVSDQEMLINR